MKMLNVLMTIASLLVFTGSAIADSLKYSAPLKDTTSNTTLRCAIVNTNANDNTVTIVRRSIGGTALTTCGPLVLASLHGKTCAASTNNSTAAYCEFTVSNENVQAVAIYIDNTSGTLRGTIPAN